METKSWEYDAYRDSPDFQKNESCDFVAQGDGFVTLGRSIFQEYRSTKPLAIRKNLAANYPGLQRR